MLYDLWYLHFNNWTLMISYEDCLPHNFFSTQRYRLPVSSQKGILQFMAGSFFCFSAHEVISYLHVTVITDSYQEPMKGRVILQVLHRVQEQQVVANRECWQVLHVNSVWQMVAWCCHMLTIENFWRSFTSFALFLLSFLCSVVSFTPCGFLTSIHWSP